MNDIYITTIKQDNEDKMTKGYSLTGTALQSKCINYYL
ncbi:hypothetical protein SAMN05444001_10377 [Parabacteroides chinchillae]|uniref:Uncharacterized protein n=1 Tax=Parabacteroides chinchillae TaxID=871327 RepID=A0A8G2F9U6_9BACT|nr:hypothetical protein SAMN05444001_10377 [Parabacteroides chinchillae]